MSDLFDAINGGKMRILITGGTGFVGRALTTALLGRGDQVTILSRSSPPGSGSGRCAYLSADPSRSGEWQDAVGVHDTVVNLAGASIFCRWSPENRERIITSRIRTTRHLVAALTREGSMVKTLVNGSAVGYYGQHPGDETGEIDEDGGPGDDFLATLAREWEAAACEAERPGLRVVRARLGVVIGPGGGALSRMIPPFRYGLGAPLGSGHQWFSWVCLADLVAALLFLIDNQEISGPVNCTAPHPLTNREMTRVLSQRLRRPLFLPPVPAWLLRLLLGEFSTVFLEGQRVVPAKLLRHGFQFRFPYFDDALGDVLGK